MDRAEAIRFLESIATNLTGECVEARSDKVSEYIERKIKAVDMAIAALREQERSKWISVDERLPERKDANPYESVLAIHKDDGFARSWIFDVVAEYSQEFTHWMPLPEPPKEGAEG